MKEFDDNTPMVEENVLLGNEFFIIFFNIFLKKLWQGNCSSLNICECSEFFSGLNCSECRKDKKGRPDGIRRKASGQREDEVTYRGTTVRQIRNSGFLSIVVQGKTISLKGWDKSKFEGLNSKF